MPAIHNFRRRIMSLLIVMSMFVTVFIHPTPVYSWDAHLNEAGDIEIYTADKKRTSQIWYRTIGVTITRCKYDPTERDVHESGQSFNWKLGNSSTSETGGIQYNTWTIPLSDVIAQAGGEWAKEIQDAIDGEGPACYIKLDCIMETIDDTQGGIVTGPFMNKPGTFGSDGRFITGVNAAGTHIDKMYPWANPSGLRTHFNHYLLIGNGKDPEPVIMDDELVVKDYTYDHYANIDGGYDNNQPAFATGNYSNEFNIAEGIPSSENIENLFLADAWYGKTEVWARTRGKQYSWTMHYFWKENHPEQKWDEQKKEFGWVDNWEVESEDVELDDLIGIACASFQYLANTKMYDFTNADIGNGAYDGDHIYYDDTEEVPMTCISTSEYKDVGTGAGSIIKDEPDWSPDEEEHLEFPKSINYIYSREIGSRAEIVSAAKEDAKNIQDIIFSKTKTHNDKFVIDGEEYMNDSVVIGCDFFDSIAGSYKDDISSSGWVHDYCKQSGYKPLHETDPRDVTGTATSQIPATVDNGQYYTTMRVIYQRLVAYQKTIKEFFAGE